MPADIGRWTRDGRAPFLQPNTLAVLRLHCLQPGSFDVESCQTVASVLPVSGIYPPIYLLAVLPTCTHALI